ncbi:MAG: CpsD/CapB family tyrosine-protein kinase [Blastocatellia bacterium]
MSRRVTQVAPDLVRFENNESQSINNGHDGHNGKNSLESRVTKGLPDNDHALESQSRQLQPRQQLLRPACETELTLARLDPHLVAIHELDPRAVAQYNKLAVSIISGAAKRIMKRVLLVSAHHGEGRTCVTLNLAAALARARRRVLVVDTDLQRPSVNRLLGIDSEVGLAEAVAHNLRPEEAVMRVLPADFHVLPTRGQVENSAELLASPAFGRLVTTMELLYDFILFDSAPLLASADASLLGLHSDAIVLVVKPGNTSTSDMAKSIAQINEESFFGVVMNRVES